MSKKLNKKPLERLTQRLLVRPLKSADYLAWKQALNSFHASKNSWDLGHAPAEKLTRSEFKNLLSKQKKLRQDDSFLHFAVFMRASGKFIGSTALMDISRGIFCNAYLGYWIGNTSWGSGYGKEAAQATLEIAFQDLCLHRVEAGIAPGNRRSIALAKCLKMRREGLSARRLYLQERWQDLLIYAITSEELGISCQPQTK